MDRATPETILASRARLALAREALHKRPLARTLDTLCALLDRLNEPDGPARKQLEAELPAATGFHASTVREGLAHALPKFDGDALRALLDTERAAAGTARFEGFSQTSVLLAGSIPMPTFTSLLFPLLLHSPVLAKTASRDAVSARVFADAVRAIDPELASCIEIVSFPSEDAACSRALLEADCVVATGTDETIHTTRASVSPTTRFVGYGHRLSVAAIGAAAIEGRACTDVAEGMARDIALWDQQGCLSPVAVFCETGPEGARSFADALFEALERVEVRLPCGEISAESSAAIRREREEALMRRADSREVAVLASAGTRVTVIVEDDLRWRPAPLHRFVRVCAAKDRAALIGAVAPLGRHLAAVAVAGFGASTAEVSQAFARLGASRVCAPGEMQAPPLAWHHDGQLLLAPLARLTDVD